MVFPAAVTPFDARGRVDPLGVSRLIAHFEAAGCDGVVLAGTNGEGPSLSAVEKRDLLAEQAETTAIKLILGTGTSSLDEAMWQAKQTVKSNAYAMLVMPPGYFREAHPLGTRDWFLALLDASPVPILAYHFPQRAGVGISPETMGELAPHPNLLGMKDSSGDATQLTAYRQALPTHQLFVGDERLLILALQAGWTGTISGAANCIASWLVAIVREWPTDPESAETKFSLLLPTIEKLRSLPQPMSHKRYLTEQGIIDSARVRLPLREIDAATVPDSPYL